MKIAICDDDSRSRSDYRDLVTAIAERRGLQLEIEEYETGNQLGFALAGPEDPPDIIFLDILMPGPDGIETGRKLRENGYSGIIIYLSQSPDYMLPAFDVGAFNYVIKSSAVKGVSRFEKVFVQAAETAEKHKRKYILLNGISEHRNLAIDTILYFESLKHVITVHYDNNERFEFISSLSRVEDALAAYGFIRTHRSYLVNCAAIRNFGFKSVVLSDGTELPIGRKRYGELKEILKENAAVSLEAEKHDDACRRKDKDRGRKA